MVSSYDPELSLVYVGTSGRRSRRRRRSSCSAAPTGSTCTTTPPSALHGDTGEIVWYYQHLNDSWDLDHPFERLLVDTAVRADASAVRATPTIPQNVISGIDGTTGVVSENSELVFTARQRRGKDWEAGAYSPLTNTMYMPLRNVCARMLSISAADESDEARRFYALAWRSQDRPRHGPGGQRARHLGRNRRDGLEPPAARRHDGAGRDRRRARVRRRRQRPLPGLRRPDRREILWEINLGSSVSGFPITFAVDGLTVRSGKHRHPALHRAYAVVRQVYIW